MKKPLSVAVLAMVSISLLAQASVDGTWNLSLETPMGALSSKLVLKTSGEDVTGTMGDPMGGADIPIKGTLKGDELSIEVTFQAPPGPIELQLKGKVSGDELKGTFSGGPATGNFTAKREP